MQNPHQPLYLKRKDKPQHSEFFSCTNSTISHYISSCNNWSPLIIEVVTTRHSWKLHLIYFSDVENVHNGKRKVVPFSYPCKIFRLWLPEEGVDPKSCHLHCRRTVEMSEYFIQITYLESRPEKVADSWPCAKNCEKDMTGAAISKLP